MNGHTVSIAYAPSGLRTVTIERKVSQYEDMASHGRDASILKSISETSWWVQIDHELFSTSDGVIVTAVYEERVSSPPRTLETIIDSRNHTNCKCDMCKPKADPAVALAFGGTGCGGYAGGAGGGVGAGLEGQVKTKVNLEFPIEKQVREMGEIWAAMDLVDIVEALTDPVHAAVVIECQAVVRQKGSERAALICDEARKFLSAKREWPKCEECHCPLAIVGVERDIGDAKEGLIRLDCSTCTRGHMNGVRFPLSERATARL